MKKNICQRSPENYILGFKCSVSHRHGTLAKTDQSDARALAQYGFERYSALSLFVRMSKEQTALVALCQRRDDITQMRTQEKCRLAAPKNDYIKESCQKTIDFFTSQINEFNDAIQRIIDKNPELQKRQKILRTVPGIGLKLSQVFVCLMPELGHLNKKEVASLAGVAPHPKESGKTIGYRRITGGRSNVRAKLFTAAMAAARSKSALGAFYSIEKCILATKTLVYTERNLYQTASTA